MTYRETLKPWADEFLATRQQPMDEEMSMAFMNLTMMEMHEKGLPPQLESSFMFRVLTKRAAYLGLDANPYAMALLACLCQSPGSAVMFLVAISYRAKVLKISTITNLFPMGFPSEEELSNLWDKQKGFNFDVKIDNMVDGVEPLCSL